MLFGTIKGNIGSGNIMDRPLTVKEAAEFLHVKPNQVRIYINKGILKAYKIGNGTSEKRSTRSWRIWEEDLVKFIGRNSNIKGGLV